MGPLVLPIFDLVGKVVDRLIPDKAAADKAKLDMMATLQTQEFSLALEQIKVNAQEASNPSIFVSGWRPFIGWVCGAGCAWNWIGLPAAKFLAVAIWNHPIAIAPADLGEMMPLLFGLLGLGGLRTVEKINGVAAK
jgi:hypothetical protein